MDAERNILCMYSGGLDSVGMLYALLSEERYAEYGIHVHHMHLLNIENRARAEDRATQATITELRSMGLRPFFYSTSGHDYRFLRSRFIWDMDISAFMAANIAAADASIAHVAMGRTSTDVASGGESFQRRMERAQKIFDAVWSLEKRPRPDYIFPVVERSKADIWLSLPEALREQAWSCRHPRYDGDTLLACGECSSCRDIARMQEELASPS